MKDRRTLLRLYTNEESKFVCIDGSLIHYRDEGEGDPILLIHGACASLHTFDAWTEILTKTHRVIRLDLPGSGLSDPPEWGNSEANETYLAYVHRFLEILGITSCAIAGNSLGGWLSWEMAIRYPKLINRLILVSSAGYIDATSIPPIFFLGRVPVLNRMGKLMVSKTFLQKNLEDVFVHRHMLTPAVIERVYDLFSQRNNTDTFLYWVSGKFKNHTRQLPKIKQPTLIIWGEQDPWIKINNAYRFNNAIEQSELVVYEDLGHVPQEEAPEKTAEDVLEFLEANPVNKKRLGKVA